MEALDDRRRRRPPRRLPDAVAVNLMRKSRLVARGIVWQRRSAARGVRRARHQRGRTGIVPDNALARAFRDAAGLTSQMIAKVADEVEFVVAGLPMRLK